MKLYVLKFKFFEGFVEYDMGELLEPEYVDYDIGNKLSEEEIFQQKSLDVINEEGNLKNLISDIKRNHQRYLNLRT